MDPLLLIAVTGLLFLVTHIALPHPPLRSALVARLGANGYLGVYSLISFATFVPFVWVWWGARHQGAVLWMLRSPPITHTVELLLIIAFALIVGGVVRPAPASIATTLQHLPVEARGLTRVTRHPMMMGMGLWALAHLLVNGWLSDVLFFGIYALTALGGAWHQDWRKSSDPAYAAVVAQTSFWPNPRGLAGLDGRSWGALAGGAGLAVLLRVFHSQLFGG